MGDIIEIDIEVLQMVANYYEFPLAVFFLPKDSWGENQNKIRLKLLLKEKDKLERIKEIVYESK